MIKAEIIGFLERAVREDGPFEVSIPENKRFGHYSTNIALKLAKSRGKNPLTVAEEIVSRIRGQVSSRKFFEKIKIVQPGFINFWLSQDILSTELKGILKSRNKYGFSEIGKGKIVVVDYSGPNVVKPMTVGHLRSTIIGQSLIYILRSQGYKTIGDNHLGDWGTQFGALIYAYKKWGNKSELDKNPVGYLVKLYVRFHKASEKNEKLIVAAREETAKLQKGDSENRSLWKLFTKESLKEFDKIYKRLDVKIDYTLGESFYQPMLAGVIEDTFKKRIAKLDDGAAKVFFDGSALSPMVIRKSDASYLYTTTDLATIKYRMKEWQPDKILYVVANEQSHHFEQVFEAAERLGYAKKSALNHVKFGMILGEAGKKMSTRRGEFIKLEELLNKAKAKAAKIDKKSAEAVGVGAVKYQSLSHERKSDIIFDWNKMLNLKGNSGPYIQYTYARLKSVLRKANGAPNKIDFNLLKSESEKSVIRQLIYFPDILARAAGNCETNGIAEYLYKLANELNGFYEAEPILKVLKPLRENRLNLIIAATTVLKNGLGLLGIEAPEKM